MHRAETGAQYLETDPAVPQEMESHKLEPRTVALLEPLFIGYV
jgi:hypothetical protein